MSQKTEPKLQRSTTAEIVSDSKNLPADIDEVEWVLACDVQALEARAKELEVDLEKAAHLLISAVTSGKVKTQDVHEFVARVNEMKYPRHRKVEE